MRSTRLRSDKHGFVTLRIVNNTCPCYLPLPFSAGLFAYHVYLIQSQFSRILDTNVLDCKKRPDYIYINYSIYKESQQIIQQQQETNKVSHLNCIIKQRNLLIPSLPYRTS